MSKDRAIIYISPPIEAVLDAVPDQSVSGRIADVCERYMRMVQDELLRAQFEPGEWEAICKVLTEQFEWFGDEWAIQHAKELARFPVAIRLAIIEQFERDKARRNSKAG